MLAKPTQKVPHEGGLCEADEKARMAQPGPYVVFQHRSRRYPRSSPECVICHETTPKTDKRYHKMNLFHHERLSGDSAQSCYTCQGLRCAGRFDILINNVGTNSTGLLAPYSHQYNFSWEWPSPGGSRTTTTPWRSISST